jgi:LPS-assembly protein
MNNLPLRPVALAIFCFFAAPTYAQQDALDLKVEPNFTPVPLGTKRNTAIFIDAERIDAQTEKELKATGNALLRQRGLTLKSDTLTYSKDEDTATAEGHVVIDKEGDIARGPYLKYQLEKEEGYMDAPEFSLAKKELRLRASRGDASKIQFEGPDVDRLFNVRYSTCAPGQDDWFLKARELELDRKVQIGTAHTATVVFKDVPIMFLPWLDFPLNGQRKSGFLTPTFGYNGKNGFELEVPYYWNIAPNYDDTITPRLLTKRGLQLGNEFRYLNRNWSGELSTEYLPNDKVFGADRYYGAWRHRQTLAPSLNLTMDLEKVSDDNYFRDLSSRIANTSQTYLPRDALLSYGFAKYWSANLHYLRYQVLQDPLAPVGTPYSYGPQAQLVGNRSDVYGANLALSNEWINFVHPTQINAQRVIVNPSISYPMTRNYGYITPKFSFNYTHYTFGDNNTQALEDITRSVPTTSVDSGLYFDRSTTLGGKQYTQTLEPRAFYVYTPFRDQSQIPNFSTSEMDFGFAQIFSENPFIGGDRIADSNQITVAATSRLIDNSNGIERIRFTLGQRYFFSPQRVTLTSPPRDSKSSDILAAVSGQISDKWTLDTGWQYNADQGTTEKLNFRASYRPKPGNVLNLGYRLTNDATDPLRQLDFSAQWQVARNWYTLSRINWDLDQRRILEALVGLEYNRDCWAIRLVAHRFPTNEQVFTNSFFVQLELTGLSSIGINPLETLKQNIPGYVKSSEITR